MDSASLYEQKANGFLGVRDKSKVGFMVVRNWAENLPDTTREVLELACGGGYPITIELSRLNFKLWAIDSSKTLLSVFSTRFPDIPTQCVRVQKSDFFNRTFDAAVAIGIMFLLKETEQAELISKVANALKTGGRFLFTAPTQVGTWKDLGSGATCTSLGYDAYLVLLKNAGFTLVDTYMDVGENHYYDVQKI